MVRGLFVDNTPWFKVALAWGQSVQTPTVILDTGFTGDLQVTPEMAKELGLEVVGVTQARIANGSVVPVANALALAAMEGVVEYVQVLISNGMPLAGIGLLTKFNYKASVDCRHRTVELQKA